MSIICRNRHAAVAAAAATVAASWAVVTHGQASPALPRAKNQGLHRCNLSGAIRD